MTSVNTLAYTYGNYRQVLEIGVALSIPRAVLYFVFVPFYGGLGAAFSFSIGTIAGLVISISVAHTLGLRIFWKDLVLMLLISTSLAFVVPYLEINYITGILITLSVSYLLLLKMRILTRDDIQDTLGALPYRISSPTIKVANVIGEKLNRHY